MQLATTTGAYFVLYAVPSMMRKGLKAVTSVTVPSAERAVYEQRRADDHDAGRGYERVFLPAAHGIPPLPL